MKAKQQIDPNAAGEEVKRLLAEDGSANSALKDIRSAKAARKEALKSALTVVWNAFESGATVNGYTTRKEWAKNFAKVTTRHCEHIIYGRKPEANVRSRVVKIKPGTVVMFGKRKFTVVTIGDPTAPDDYEDEHGVHAKWKEIAGCDHDVQLNLKEINPKPAPVTHARGVTRKGTYSTRLSLCMTRMPNRKLKGKVFADKPENVTCPECVRFRDEAAQRSKEARAKAKADKPSVTVVLKDQCPTEESL